MGRASRRRPLRPLLVRVGAALVLLGAPATFPYASAAFAGTTSDSGNVLSSSQVAPPSAFAVNVSCGGAATIGVRTPATGNTGLGSLTLPLPAGTTEGDLLLVQVANRNGASTLSYPGGWTLVRRDTFDPLVPGAAVTSAVLYKFAAAGETTPTFSLPTAPTVAMAGGMAAYTGVSTSNPVDVSGALSGGTSAPTAPSVFTTRTGTRVVTAFAKRQESAFNAPATTTQRWSQYAGSGTTTVGATLGDVLFAGSGATSTHPTSASFASEWVAQTVALRPAPGAPTASATWAASPTSWATGYRLERSIGGSPQNTATVTPVTASSATDGPLVNGTTYGYRLWAYHGTWTSTALSGSVATNC